MAERKQQTQDRSENSDVKRREYRDKEGDVHHHTHEYMERHKGKKGRGGSDRGESRQSRDEDEK